ncbi:MAG: hypothetical protein PHX16_06285 [Syntrophaceticus sp.]|nr:hypothetical protein [Syntrophaceticus sp.]MDD4360278.1 hypothetical protein [Syntrophaceticus sp.]MDD4783226.1 hypothetical protein [Syntrophaceticus sp.]HBG22159.1 hypothetical protein [Peptococcaceae bacterium]
MGFLVAFAACAGTISAALAVYYWHLGNHNILLDTAAAYEFVVRHDIPRNEITCSCLIPLSNKGEQQGMINNVFCQPVYCGKIMDELTISSHLCLVEDEMKDEMRENSYWKSLILKRNDHFDTKLVVKIHNSSIDIASLVQELDHIQMLIYYQVVGRKGIQWRLAELSVPLVDDVMVIN